MPPRFRVLAGPSSHQLEPLQVNTEGADAYFDIKTPYFEGRIVGNIKGFVDEDGERVPSRYFDREDRRNQGTTWSIQVQGRFLVPVSADDVMFGNTFERPLKLPWGTSAAMQFASFIDPVLTHDLNSKTPWALSPLISTMPHFKATRCQDIKTLPSFDPMQPFKEDVSALFDGSQTPPTPLVTASKRRKWFEKENRRKAVKYTPETVLQMDFCYGYFQFPELVLAIPGGITFDLKKYWDKQPVRFVCCERAENGKGPGREFFVVQFEQSDIYDTSGSETSSRSSSAHRSASPPNSADVD